MNMNIKVGSFDRLSFDILKFGLELCTMQNNQTCNLENYSDSIGCVFYFLLEEHLEKRLLP